MAVDGHYIEPMQVDWAQVTIGSRLSVMVELDPKLEGNIFPIRLTGARALQPIEGHAFLSYIDEISEVWNPSLEEDFGYATRALSNAHVPMSGFTTDPSLVKWQQNLSFPFDPISKVPQESNMTLHAVASQNSLNVWQIASVPLDTVHLADERPMLFNFTDGNATSNQMDPYATIPFGTVVDIILENNIYSIVGGPNSPHPFHMHSRRFWIIGSGSGPFPADTVAGARALNVTFNLDNPPLRDGFDIDANSWVVIRYIVDHAAANILHCHIDDHAIEGMAAVLLEGLETIPAGGNFSETIKARPSNFVETQNDELGSVLEKAWESGAVASKWIEPAPTDTVSPWGDPRLLAKSIELFASSNSVQRSISSSLQSQMSAMQATATGTVTAITATVSDYLTTFTGAPASTVTVATATTAAATAAATQTPASAAEVSTDAIASTPADTAESTVIAAAYTADARSSSASATLAAAATASVVTNFVTQTVTAYVTYTATPSTVIDASPTPIDTVFETESAAAAYSTVYESEIASVYSTPPASVSDTDVLQSTLNLAASSPATMSASASESLLSSSTPAYIPYETKFPTSVKSSHSTATGTLVESSYPTTTALASPTASSPSIAASSDSVVQTASESLYVPKYTSYVTPYDAEITTSFEHACTTHRPTASQTLHSTSLDGGYGTNTRPAYGYPTAEASASPDGDGDEGDDANSTAFDDEPEETYTSEWVWPFKRSWLRGRK